MTYKKQSRDSYRPVRKRVSGTSRLHSISTSQVQVHLTPRHRKTQKAQQFYANVMDLMRFLSKYLSGTQNIILAPDRAQDAGYSCGHKEIKGKDFYEISIPSWPAYDIPLDELQKYVIYRNGTWHESMHAKYTPLRLFTYGGSNRLEHDVCNIIEDRRIEDLGVEEWKGYISDRLVSNAYAFSLRPDVGEMWNEFFGPARLDPNSDIGNVKNAKAAVRHEAILQRIIIGKAKGLDQLPKQEQEKIENVARTVEKELDDARKHKDNKNLVYDKVTSLTQRVINDLELRGNGMWQPPALSAGGAGQSGGEGMNSWDDTFTSSYPKNQGKTTKETKKDMKEFFTGAEKDAEERAKKEKAEKSQAKREAGADKGKSATKPTKEDIQNAVKGSEQVRREFEQAQKMEIDEFTPMFVPVAAATESSLYRDKKFQDQMHTALREWRIGRKEVYGEAGARLTIPRYIRSAKKEPFVTRIKKSAKGRKILVIADFSGSIRYAGQEDNYKKALVNGMEVLDTIGTKTALFGFGGEQGNPNPFFFKVKRFEDPKWKPIHSSKTAALAAHYPSTPTDSAYASLLPYIKKHRPHVTVTCTDGEPDNERTTAGMVRGLKRHTRMVAFGIGPKAEKLQSDLDKFGYHRTFAVSDMDRLPRQLVDLVAPTGRGR